MTSLGGKLTALVCCPAKYVNKAEKKRTFLSANIEVYDNEITSLIDIYFLRISFIPSDPFRYFIYVTYSTDK